MYVVYVENKRLNTVSGTGHNYSHNFYKSKVRKYVDTFARLYLIFQENLDCNIEKVDSSCKEDKENKVKRTYSTV